MRFSRVCRALAIAAVIGVSAPAAALNCYLIVDQANEVIFQDTTPPIDLSDEGAPARDALRARGQQLVAMDTERCPGIDRARIIGKGGPATVDEIIAGMRPAVPFGARSNASPAAGTTGGIALPRITVPRATDGGGSGYVPISGMGVR